MNYDKDHFDLRGGDRRHGGLSMYKRTARRCNGFGCRIAFLLLAAWWVSGGSVLASGQGTIHLDAERKLVTLADGQGQLALRLNYDGRCVLDQVIVRGREVAAESGVVSGIRMDGRWFTTRTGIATPSVAIGRTRSP